MYACVHSILNSEYIHTYIYIYRYKYFHQPFARGKLHWTPSQTIDSAQTIDLRPKLGIEDLVRLYM